MEHFAVMCRKAADDPLVDADMFTSFAELQALLHEKPSFVENYGDISLTFAQDLADAVAEADTD